MISGKDVKKLADLARIEVDESELENLANEMDGILEYVGQVAAFSSNTKENPKEIEPRNVLREDNDSNEPGMFSKELIAEFPDSENGYLKVKKIL